VNKTNEVRVAIAVRAIFIVVSLSSPGIVSGRVANIFGGSIARCGLVWFGEKEINGREVR
jgi:hypothetical protein